MIRVLLLFSLAVWADDLFGEGDTIMALKHFKIWVCSSDGSVQKGTVIAGTATSLQIFAGNSGGYKNDRGLSQTMTLGYENVSFIKIEKVNGLVKGLLIGRGIGLVPLIFGQGGAVVAIAAFPLGIITGSVIGATSKRKCMITET